MACPACPFSMSDAAAQGENWGCLPSPFEIMAMTKRLGQNWSCHDAENRLCGGYAAYCSESHIPLQDNPNLLTLTAWDRGEYRLKVQETLDHGH